MGTLVGTVGRLAYWRFGMLLLLAVDETVRGHVMKCAFCGRRRGACGSYPPPPPPVTLVAYSPRAGLIRNVGYGGEL